MGLETRATDCQTQASFELDFPGQSHHIFRSSLVVTLLVFTIGVGLMAPGLITITYLVVGYTTFTSAHDSFTLEQAVEHFRNASRWAPRNPQPLRLAARANIALGRYDEAVSLLEEAYRLSPSSLLIRQELAAAYDLDRQYEKAVLLWGHLGVTAERAAQLGDQYLRAGAYREAWRWYRLLLDNSASKSSERLLWMTLAANVSGAPEADALLAEFDQGEMALNVTSLVDDRLTLDGAELRWLLSPGSHIPVGAPLSFGSGDKTNGYMWGNGQAFSIVEVLQDGRYALDIQVMHAPPAPVLLAFGIDGRRVSQYSLERGDYSSETITLALYLDAGRHSLDFWFLNDGVVEGLDRNAVIERVTLRRIQ
jgi:tetratricopeptide (TPR) repeat protein